MDAESTLFSGSVADGYREYLEPVIFRPWAERLIDFVGLADGQTVLDVAAGTGVVSRAAATRVGPAGRVIAVDVSPAMLSHVPNGFPSETSLTTLECSATALELSDASVDVVLCQQGLPFIPDRRAAAREMFRALRPGGKAGVAVWQSSPRIEPFIIYGDALQAHGVPEAFPGAYDTSITSMSTDEAHGALEAAGFDDIEVRLEQMDVEWPSTEHAVRAIFGTPFGPAIGALESSVRDEILADVRRRMTGPGGATAKHTMTSVFARGRRPDSR